MMRYNFFNFDTLIVKLHPTWLLGRDTRFALSIGVSIRAIESVNEGLWMCSFKLRLLGYSVALMLAIAV